MNYYLSPELIFSSLGRYKRTAKVFWLNLLFLTGIVAFLPIESKAIWIVGKRLTSQPNIYCPDGKEFDKLCCLNLVGECGSLVKWRGMLSAKKFEAFEKGHLIFFENEPDVPTAIEVDIKIAKGLMKIRILKMKGTDKFFFDIPQDTQIEEESSRLLGFKEIKIKKGKYSVCYTSENSHGETNLKVISKKL